MIDVKPTSDLKRMKHPQTDAVTGRLHRCRVAALFGDTPPSLDARNERSQTCRDLWEVWHAPILHRTERI